MGLRVKNDQDAITMAVVKRVDAVKKRPDAFVPDRDAKATAPR